MTLTEALAAAEPKFSWGHWVRVAYHEPTLDLMFQAVADADDALEVTVWERDGETWERGPHPETVPAGSWRPHGADDE